MEQNAACLYDSSGRVSSCKHAAFCSMCGPKFCSMNYSTKVDEYNKEVHGLEKKDYSELVEKFITIK